MFRPPLRAALTLGVSTALLAGPTLAHSALPAAGADPLAKYTAQQLTWEPCSFNYGQPSSTQCAFLTVPRDWAKPDSGKDLRVYVSKVPATGPKASYLGVLLTNPGGPGGQGASLPQSLAQLQPKLNAAYDVLGMDPRGTGQEGGSDEAALGSTCKVPLDRLPTGLLDARDRSRDSIRQHQQIPLVVAQACQSVAEAPYITTWQTAHDMDLYRQLLGAPKLNYVGYSYGTWLGAKYASLFPATTGRFVLDSSVNWQGRLQADFEDFPRMGQRQTDKVFLPWLNRVSPETFGTTVASARKAIELGRKNAVGLGISPDQYDTLLVGNGSQVGWFIALINLTFIIELEPAAQQRLSSLPAGLRQLADEAAKQRLGVPLAQLTTATLVAKNLGVDPTDYGLVPLTRYAVACGDQTTKTTQWYKNLSDSQGPQYPIFGWQYGLTEVCGPWSDEPRQELPLLSKAAARNVLVVQGEFDPQTAYEQAMAAVDKAPNVSVLRVDDSPFHGQYAIQGNPCVDGVVNTYLLFGSKVANGLCPSIPLPGEKEVFATRGPVDAYLKQGKHAAKVELTTRNAYLGRELADTISMANNP
ncbi:alpha/beta fold hydrolase [Kribbella sp. NPDC056861]|uniref:alpha/beta fold hydrolase n=1 Tax=Kribbella sp. NPDC056861 TaxID=3154857 RepID=UPI00344810C6